MTIKANIKEILKETNSEALFELFAELTEIFIEKDLELGKIDNEINDIIYYYRKENSDSELKDLLKQKFSIKQELVYLSNIKTFTEKRMMILQYTKDSDSLKIIAHELEKRNYGRN